MPPFFRKYRREIFITSLLCSQKNRRDAGATNYRR